MRYQFLPEPAPLNLPYSPFKSFNHIRQIRIRNSGSKLTNYQVKLELNSNIFPFEKVRSDGADIRFVDDTGEALSYWLESWSSTSGNTWIKIPEIAGQRDKRIWIVYGNINAISESNFNNTFIFGELWNIVTIDTEKWPTINGTPAYTINTVNHYLEVTNVADDWNTGNGFTSKLFNFPAEYIIERARGSGGFQLYINSTVAELTHILLGNHHGAWSSSDYGVAFAALQDGWDGNTHGRNAGVGGNTDYSSGGGQGQIATIEWTIYKLGGNITVKEAETTRVSEANAETPDRIHIGLSKLASYAFGTVRLYDFKIRKYASPEPVIEII